MSYLKSAFDAGRLEALSKFALEAPTAVDSLMANVDQGKDMPPEQAEPIPPPEAVPGGMPEALPGEDPSQGLDEVLPEAAAPVDAAALMEALAQGQDSGV